MDNQQLATLITAIIGVLAGAILGGGAAIVILGRIVKSVLESPVLLKALEGAFASLPPEYKEAVHDTGKLLEAISDNVPTEVQSVG